MIELVNKDTLSLFFISLCVIIIILGGWSVFISDYHKTDFENTLATGQKLSNPKDPIKTADLYYFDHPNGSGPPRKFIYDALDYHGNILKGLYPTELTAGKFKIVSCGNLAFYSMEVTNTKKPWLFRYKNWTWVPKPSNSILSNHSNVAILSNGIPVLKKPHGRSMLIHEGNPADKYEYTGLTVID